MTSQAWKFQQKVLFMLAEVKPVRDYDELCFGKVLGFKLHSQAAHL